MERYVPLCRLANAAMQSRQGFMPHTMLGGMMRMPVVPKQMMPAPTVNPMMTAAECGLMR